MKEYEIFLLSDRPPVRLKLANWPIIARGDGGDDSRKEDYEGIFAWIKVRQKDRQVLVYGECEYWNAHQGATRGFRYNAGIIDDTTRVVEAIKEVGARLRELVLEEGHKYSRHVAAAVREAQESCIQSLPAEDLD